MPITFVDVKDSYASLDDSLEVIVRDGRGERVGAAAVRARREGRDEGSSPIPAPVYYPDARSALREGSSRGGRERMDDAAASATATTAETLRLLGVFSFTREREPEPELLPQGRLDSFVKTRSSETQFSERLRPHFGSANVG